MTAAIHLASENLKVRLYEKEKYPHHKVCGEYLSKEILPYLNSLGIDLNYSGPADITSLVFSDRKGTILNTPLPLGGIGISRYKLDHTLYEKAVNLGVDVCHETVIDVDFKENLFFIKDRNGTVNSNFVLGAYGKRSNLDKKLNRDFISRKTGWLAVKGHYKNKDYPGNVVSLHNFNGGYCGLSRTETEAINVCYLATYTSFKKYKNPEGFKNEVLAQNPNLKDFFKKSSPVFLQDLTIAQISFEKKKQVDNHILMIGDAAGLIHPLCGNGMAMAIHSAKLVSETILESWNKGKFDRNKIEKVYIKKWKKTFRSRLRMGRILQRILLDQRLSNIGLKFMYRFPSLLPAIIKKTHGHRVI